jgi:hypothetical protein
LRRSPIFAGTAYGASSGSPIPTREGLVVYLES